MLTIEQAKEIISNFDSDYAIDCMVEYEGVEYYLREKDGKNWTSSGKWETNYYVYDLVYGDECKETGFLVGQNVSRTGSYYSDYYYECGELRLVKEVEETAIVKKWIPIEG